MRVLRCKAATYKVLSSNSHRFTHRRSSHGFDPNGSTTGFVIWANGSGIMVDPPPGSSQALEKLSIPPRLIKGIILTHCHADHDAGTFQKILKEQQVNLYTTETIFKSFMRKYSAISGE